MATQSNLKSVAPIHTRKAKRSIPKVVRGKNAGWWTINCYKITCTCRMCRRLEIFTLNILIRSLKLKNSKTAKKTSTDRKLTSGTAVQNSQIINAWTSIVGCRPVIPNDNNLLVTFKVPHRSYVSFASILLSPSPVGSSDNSITHVFHLTCENTEYTKGNCHRSHLSSSFRTEEILPMCLLVPIVLSTRLDFVHLPLVPGFQLGF